MANKIEMVGNKYSRLTVIQEAPTRQSGKYKKRYVLCKCDCGKEKEIRAEDLRRSKNPVRSCGCLTIEKTSEAKTTHGESKTNTYNIWCAIKSRCDNPNNVYYYCYGEKGITYCEEWKQFENFLKDMGQCPKGYSIERLDINKNYSKDNCIWLPLSEQTRNKSDTKLNKDLVKEMRALYNSGVNGTEVAQLYKEKYPNIGYSTLEQAVYGYTWKNI